MKSPTSSKSRAPVRQIGVTGLLVLAGATLLSGCAGSGRSGSGAEGRAFIRIVAYNVENLFDDVSNGTEYPEFDPKTGAWSTTLFRERLDNVGKVLRDSVSGGPDIVALEEIENLNVLKSLVKSQLGAMHYRDYLLVPVAGSAINIGFISRYPITSVLTHAVASTGEHPLRAVLEIHLDVDGVPLVIFACHWKSKSGGAGATEPERRDAAAIIVGRVRAILSRDSKAEVVVLGDLNESVDEYERTAGAYQTGIIAYTGINSAGNGLFPSNTSTDFLRDSIIASPVGTPPPAIVSNATGSVSSSPSAVVLYSPWGMLGADHHSFPSNEGSYYYHGWETIDQFLLSPGLLDKQGLTFADFQVVRLPYLLDKSGHPFAWHTDSRSGYSDHLPILLVLRKAGA